LSSQEERRKRILRKALRRELGDSRRDDVKASKEKRQIGSGISEEDIEASSRVKEAARTEEIRDHFKTIAILTLYLVFGTAVILGAVWLYHLLALDGWRRLPEEQLDKIQTIVAGGAIIGAVKDYFRKRLD